MHTSPLQLQRTCTVVFVTKAFIFSATVLRRCRTPLPRCRLRSSLSACPATPAVRTCGVAKWVKTAGRSRIGSNSICIGGQRTAMKFVTNSRKPASRLSMPPVTDCTCSGSNNCQFLTATATLQHGARSDSSSNRTCARMQARAHSHSNAKRDTQHRPRQPRCRPLAQTACRRASRNSPSLPKTAAWGTRRVHF